MAHDPLATQDDDIQLQNPQDDVTTSTGQFDTVTHEMTDDAADITGMSHAELKDELSNRALDEGGDPGNNEARFGSDDAENEIEDQDEDMGEAGKSA